jgi:hypothetical protein
MQLYVIYETPQLEGSGNSVKIQAFWKKKIKLDNEMLNIPRKK